VGSELYRIDAGPGHARHIAIVVKRMQVDPDCRVSATQRR
jgi:hypothetical protein